MKKYLLIVTTILFVFTNAFSAIDTSECDKIKGWHKTGLKIDCIRAIKKKNKNGFINKKIDKVTNSLEKFNEKKKKVDEENKTLWKMYKNMSKNDK